MVAIDAETNRSAEEGMHEPDGRQHLCEGAGVPAVACNPAFAALSEDFAHLVTLAWRL